MKQINIPNILTVLRILLTPLFVIFLQRGLFSFALLVFIVAAVSDGLDGLLARYFKQHTVLGAYLDPIADKLLLASAFVSLSLLKFIPGWLTIIVLSRDILILFAIAVFTITDTAIEMKPSLPSKFTTVAQLSTIFFVLLNTHFPSIIIFKPFLFWITASLTILSGFHYIYFGLNVLQEGTGNKPETK
ncbi:MAG: CDP-alcohol phosphatidyltransferase family protein [Desulfobacterales bacterium]|nr:CDP-alcohol phosphatidyltransferase family protein [Desulfobacterales bacterium]